MESGTASPSRDLIKCCDCGCDCSPDSWIRSVKRRHEESENQKRFSIPELDEVDAELFSNPKVHLENECELLRETVTSQQQSIQELYDELEKERNAASTAAEEAMSVMQRLQNEKADLQMQLRQHKNYSEDKIEHDQQKIFDLEDVLYQREQTIQALTFEVQAYKHRMMSFGLTEAEAEGEKSLLSREPSMISEYDLPAYDYPPLKCNINENHDDPLEADIYVADDENYPPAYSPHGREHLKTLDLRISQMETNPSFPQLNGDFVKARGMDVSEKAVVGQSPRRQRQFRRISTAGSSSQLGASKDLKADIFVDSPRSESYSSKKVGTFSYTENYNAEDESSEIGDDMSDRVYTIDSVHQGASHSVVTDQKLGDETSDGKVVFPREQMDLDDPDITKLYMRLQALEADRESMKQALISMRTEKAQMVLLKEIAQHLVPQRRLPLRKASNAGPLTFTPVFKWITSFVSWRRKARRSKYMYGVSANNMGLQMLLEKVPRSRKWRCLRSTQV
uniref:GTD-binding domain-containing protein n=1 Tax=Noccaea caerulescens TaxID=107243 RepID=A0A1J3HYY5_NOCCA